MARRDGGRRGADRGKKPSARGCSLPRRTAANGELVQADAQQRDAIRELHPDLARAEGMGRGAVATPCGVGRRECGGRLSRRRRGQTMASVMF
eukprot:493454-Prymnesium_polylepis.1